MNTVTAVLDIKEIYSPLYAPYSFLGDHYGGHLDRAHSSSYSSSSSHPDSQHSSSSVGHGHGHGHPVPVGPIVPRAILLGPPPSFIPIVGRLHGPVGQQFGPSPPITRPSTVNKYISDDEDLSESKIVSKITRKVMTLT